MNDFNFILQIWILIVWHPDPDGDHRPTLFFNIF
jgi:hypothetical protein